MLEKRSSEGVSVGNDGTASSSKSQLQCCLFCYRICDDVNSNNYNICATKTSNDNVSTTSSVLNPSQPLMKKFLMLFQRGLIDNKRIGTQSCLLPVPFENRFERLGTCQDCSILLQDFCTLYDQIKCLELKLSWRLKGLHDIMKSADKVPSRLKAFRNLVVTNERGEKEMELGKETLIEIKKFRNGLIETCSAKVQSTYPKILLKRCKLSEAQCSECGENKRIKMEMVETETPSTTSGNESKSHAVPKHEPITVKPLNVVDEDPIVDISSVFPAHVKVPSFEDAEESCDSSCAVKPLNVEDGSSSIDDVSSIFPFSVKVPQAECDEESSESNCDGNIETETSDKLGCQIGGDVRLSSPGNIQVDDNNPATPCTSSKLHSEQNQNQKVCERKKCDQNQFANTNIASKMTEQLEESCESVPISKKERRHSKRLLNRAKAVETQRPNNNVPSVALSKTCKQSGLSQKEETCPLPSPEEDSDNDDDDYVPEPDDDADSTSEVDAHELDYDDNHISIKEARNIFRHNKVEEKSAEVNDPTNSFTNMNSKGKTGLLSLKQLAMNSVLDLPLKLRCKIYSCRHTSFISSKDLANHSKWHANFECNFCELTFDYAPSLVKHEINEHTKEGEKDLEYCARCNFSGKGDRFSILTHYLNSHLDLPPPRRTCPICDALLRKDVSLRKAFLKHFNIQHNLTQRKRQSNHLVPTEFKIACTFPNCKMMFETEATMEYHKRRMHESKVRSCSQTSKSILPTTPEDPVCYLFKGQQPKIHKCDKSECVKQFYNVLDLEIHSRLHGDFKCQFCSKTFTFAPDLPVHEIKCAQRRKGEKLENSVCTRCFCKVSTEKKFISHFLEKHLELKMDRHTCLICGAHFSAINLKNIQDHFRKNHDLRSVGQGGKTYDCEMEGCSAYFLKQNQLENHKRAHVSFGKFKIRDECDDGKRYECSDCGKRLKCMWTLRRHQEHSHLNMRLKPLACKLKGCLARFNTQEELDDHVAQTGVMKCPKCDQLLHGGAGLKTHLFMSHRRKEIRQPKNVISKPPNSTINKWQCEECGKNFKWKFKLSHHRLVHSGPASWEYMCNICSKKCMTKGKLDEHMRIHTNEKTFICEICGVKYKHRHNLRIHVNSKHGDIAYDKPQNFDKTNLTSRKGIKLKSNEGAGAGTRKSKRNGSKQTQKKKYDSSSDSNFSE